MEKGRSKKRSRQDQSSPGVLNGSQPPPPVGYETQAERIDDLPPDSIQPCPYIPDYQTPTLSTQPIVVRTPEGCFCIDGWPYIERAKADGRSTIRSHIFEIKSHSDIELAIRKAAVRVMPLGGRCLYAEVVRNTIQLYQALQGISDDLVMFTHGGARRGADFTDSKENNIRAVLANRLGKSQTTINKYLQHGDGLTSAAMEELVNNNAPKKFFEAIQAPKQILVVAQKAEQKDTAAIAEVTSKEVMQWFAESLKVESPPTAEQGQAQDPHAEGSGGGRRNLGNGNRRAASTPRSPQNDSGDNQGTPSTDFTPTDGTDLAAELKRIGEALIGIAESQESPVPQKIEGIHALIVDLSTLLQRLAQSHAQNGSETGGAE